MTRAPGLRREREAERDDDPESGWEGDEEALLDDTSYDAEEADEEEDSEAESAPAGLLAAAWAVKGGVRRQAPRAAPSSAELDATNLYLRDIGFHSLLTSEQEVTLSRKIGRASCRERVCQYV